MIVADLPKNENDRLKELKNYNILDTKEEKDFNDIVELASAICETPISLVSLVDNYRQWFKAKTGLEANETPKDIAFCAHALLQDEVFIVPDASKDERFSDNPLVTENPNIRFYAGMPLKTPKGYNLGSLCVIDTVPRDLSDNQIKALKVLSKQVINLFELKKKNEELTKSNEIKSKLLSIISHDLKSPISNLDLFLQILENKFLTLEESKEHLVSLRTSLQSTFKLMDSLFLWAKSQMTSYVFDIKSINLFDLIQDEIDKCYEIAQQKNNKVENLIYNDEVISGDKNQLSYIFRNLLNNSIKFTKNGSITFSSIRKDNLLEMKIEDTGIGMDEETKDKLFDWSGKNSRNGTNGEIGTGFGLLVVEDFLKNHNATIKIESEVNKGTIIKLFFPINE